MTLIFFGLLLVIAAGSAGLLLMTRIRLLDASMQASGKLPDAERYRPMLRILSEEDLGFVRGNRALMRKIRTRRREIFRGYLRCLTKDYARLLSGLRRTMVQSGVDRPDLAGAIAKNRFHFALALCRIEVHLQLHALGIGKVDVSGLVEALDALRGVVNIMTPAAGATY